MACAGIHREFVSRLVPGALLLSILAGCEPRPSLPPLQEIAEADTSYVQLFPAFEGFTNPQDIMIGQDQLLYVADTDADRLVMMNRAGTILGTRTMFKPLSVAQTSRLDLLVGGEVVDAAGQAVGAIFRIKLFEAAHQIALAPIETVWTEPSRPRRRFPSITVFGDNEYLVVRTVVEPPGPDNSSFIDPDTRVLWFSRNDVFITPVPALTTRLGSGITDIFVPTGIQAFPDVRDFVITQVALTGIVYGALWMRYEQTVDFVGWLPRFDPARIEDRTVDFIRPNRFLAPQAVTIDRSRRDIFIADAELDSVFKFDSRGRFKQESFGFVRSGGAMVRPTGLAFFERVLYVLDGQAGRVLRFRLSTDIPR